MASQSWATNLSPEYLAESRVSSFVAGSVVPVAISTIFVLARFYTRLSIQQTWTIDDSLILLAWFGAIALTGIDFAFIAHGIGKHVEASSMSDIATILKLSYAIRIVYQFVLTTTKLAICFFYLQILTLGNARYACFGIMAYTILSTIPIIFMMIFQCTPISNFWSVPPGKCAVSNFTVVVTMGVLNIVGDVGLILCVVPRIARLHMPLKQKLSVIAIVATYMLVIVAAILRVVFSARSDNNIDQTWNYVTIGIWSLVEVNTGIFCVAVIAITPLLRKIHDKLFSKKSSQKLNNTDESAGWKEKRAAFRNETALKLRDLEHPYDASALLADSQSQIPKDHSHVRSAWPSGGGKSPTLSGSITKSIKDTDSEFDRNSPTSIYSFDRGGKEMSIAEFPAVREAGELHGDNSTHEKRFEF